MNLMLECYAIFHQQSPHSLRKGKLRVGINIHLKPHWLSPHEFSAFLNPSHHEKPNPMGFLIPPSFATNAWDSLEFQDATWHCRAYKHHEHCQRKLPANNGLVGQACYGPTKHPWLGIKFGVISRIKCTTNPVLFASSNTQFNFQWHLKRCHFLQKSGAFRNIVFKAFFG